MDEGDIALLKTYVSKTIYNNFEKKIIIFFNDRFKNNRFVIDLKIKILGIIF